jgi:glyoxylase-like metal-dependent hydrolase (beta-lactamase superfamily II)
MSDDITFNKTLDLEPNRVHEVVPGVRRILCNNPSPFTMKGTMSYIVGKGKVAIVDPGPKDEAHTAALLDAVRGETVTHILVTHSHRDHSPASADIKAATGAPILAEGPHRAARSLNVGEPPRMEAGGDTNFRPDRVLSDGEVVTGPGWTIEAITTPGHAANHMAFALKEANAIFSGDHIMGWSTTIVAPPDGSMVDYMNSLHKMAARPEPTYFSGHGDTIRNAQAYVQMLIHHREGREASILHRLQKGPADIPTLVRAIYIGLDPRLIPAAGLSVLAHLEDLVARKRVATDGAPSILGVYRLLV